MMQTADLFTSIAALANDLLAQETTISPERRQKLIRLADYIHQCRKDKIPARLHFICTHNSRRSHLGQIWASVAATHFGVEHVETFSGGTEATAFQPRAIEALKRVGFLITSEDTRQENPQYEVQYADSSPKLKAWSKVFDDAANPRAGFAAVMTCSEADDNCPFIPGAAFRLALTYEDPKVADGTPEEAGRYDQSVREIGLELLWVMREVSLRPLV